MPGITEKEKNVFDALCDIAKTVLSLKVGETYTLEFKDGPMTVKRVA